MKTKYGEIKVKIEDGVVKTVSPFSWEIVEAWRKIPSRKWKPAEKENWFSIFDWDKFVSVFEAEVSEEIENKIKENIGEYIYKGTDFKLPLYDFQKIGSEFLITKKKAFLCDVMGLGKTVQTIAAIDYLFEKKKIDVAVVFVINSLKRQWENEFKKFTPHLKVVVVDGDWKKRKNIYNSDYDVIIINYEKVVLEKDYEEIENITEKRCAIVLDEATRIKNWKAKTSKRIVALRADYKWVLTGTPVETKPEDVWNINRFLENNYLGESFWQFRDRYIRMGGWEGKEIIGYKNLDDLRKRLKPIMMRRTKEIVKDQLPKLIENNYYIELSDIERKFYNKIQMNVDRVFEEYENGDIRRARMNAMVLVGVLKQYLNHPLSIEKSDSVILKGLWKIINECKTSTKFEELKKIVEDIRSQNHDKIIIFTEYKRMAKIMKEEYPEASVIWGGQSQDERENEIKKFFEDRDIMVVVGSSGGYGLNLQAASYVINYDLPWNPAKLEQRISRAYRMGNKSDTVNVINLIIEDEEKIERIVERKLKMRKEIAREIVGDDY